MNNRRFFLKKLGLSAAGATLLPNMKLISKEAYKNLAPCAVTTPDYYGQGPFYLENAPLLSNNQLNIDTDAGEKIAIKGTVYSQDCRTTIPYAILDVWHANHAGAYDNEGFHFRGKIEADKDGNYFFETILPGKYLNGPSYRPRHIHLKISGAEHTSLTTQLYFQGDTDIPGDAAASISSGNYNAANRIIPLIKNTTSQKLEGTFDISLQNEHLQGVEEQSLHLEFGLITDILPNPVQEFAVLKYSVFKPSEVAIRVSTIKGAELGTFFNEKLPAGKYQKTFSPQEFRLTSGTYLLSLQINHLTVHHKKITIV